MSKKNITGFVLLIFLFLGTGYISGQKISERPVLFKLPGMEKVKVNKNLIYKNGWDGKLAMDVYSPPGLKKNKKLPVVILVHGGTRPNLKRQIKDWEFFTSYGRIIASSGMIAVSFNHRNFYGNGMTEDGVKESFDDVLAAIMYIRKNADNYNIDPERICLWSFSASGNQLAIPIIHRMKFVKCIISYYAIMALDTGNKYMKNFKNKKNLYKYSFLDQIKKNEYIPPILIARAGKDTKRLNDTIDQVVSKALKFNIEIELMNHPEGRHAFDIFNDNKRTVEIITRTLNFIKSKIK